MKCLAHRYSGNNLIKEQAHQGMQSQSLCQLTLGLHSSRDSVYLSRVGLTIFSDLEKATRNQNRRRTHIFLPGPSWSSNPGTRPSATHLGCHAIEQSGDLQSGCITKGQTWLVFFFCADELPFL